MIGKKLGHYEIRGPLGTGAMGEVYRARDTTLDRDVAIKVLSESLAGDETRLARFEREAKLLASLNHANIASVYGLGVDDDRRFIVMELVEGETLTERIVRRPRMTVDEALAIAHQIAEALETAHNAGIVHRDVKPSNVLLTPGGAVKVLDFGLAKGIAFEADEPAANLTRDDALMGTPPYMSPEQIRCEPTDKRADIWGFGCVLYEMLAGTGAFHRETVGDSLAAVLETEPNWDRLPAGVPPSVSMLVRRCLEKDVRQRIRDLGDARLAMDGAFETTTLDVAGMRDDSRSAAGSRKLGIAAGVGIGLLAAVAVSQLPLWNSPPPLPQRFHVDPPNELQLLSGSGTLLAIAPDGQSLAYAANRGTDRLLYLRRMNERGSIPIPGTEGAANPAFSPHGEQLTFAVLSEDVIKIVSLAGGPPFILCEGCGRHAPWDDEGSLVVIHESGFARITPGGSPVPIPTDLVDLGIEFTRHRLLPGGIGAVFAIRGGGVGVVSFETGEVVTATNEGSAARYSPTGHILFPRGETLFALAFDIEAFATEGQPVPVLQNVRVEVGGALQAEISHDGTLIYVPAVASDVSTLVWVDRQGGRAPVTDWQSNFRSPRLAPDGKQIAVGAERQIWIHDIEASSRQSLTSGESTASDPVWSPTGDRIVFSTGVGAASAIYWTRADFGGEIEFLLDPEYDVSLTSISPSGVLALHETVTGMGRNVMVMGTENGGELRPIVNTAFNERSPVVSPDGTWFAYVSDRTGADEVYVEAFPGGGQRTIVSSGGAREPRWNPNGREIFYKTLSGRFVAVPVTTEPSFAVTGRPEELFDTAGFLANAATPEYDVDLNGDRFLMVLLPVVEGFDSAGAEARSQINVVLNWVEELRAQVSTGR